jgi:hypothetical protein
MGHHKKDRDSHDRLEWNIRFRVTAAYNLSLLPRVTLVALWLVMENYRELSPGVMAVP